jgi:myo-inositol 2-dehydrogenase/D-chiro-inositol 1-dehydrogenase
MPKTNVLRLALLGAGRMGVRHAENLATLPQGRLVRIFDPDLAAAKALAEPYGCPATDRFDDVLSATDYDAVILATPTATHVDLISTFAKTGKAIICEKPIDIRLDRIEQCRKAIEGTNVPLQIAFNRRYDAGHSALAQAVRAGEIGNVEICHLTSRDWMVPPKGYIARSGGIFHDMMIHDFDMIRFITGLDTVSVHATGSALFLDEARASNDLDTAAVTLTLSSGAICQINASRRAVYGHDQRIEVHGEKGMLISQNRTPHNVERYTADATGAHVPFIGSSRDRYRDAYRGELGDFIDRVLKGERPAVTFEDGYRAAVVADAATRSFQTGQTVKLEWPR